MIDLQKTQAFIARGETSQVTRYLQDILAQPEALAQTLAHLDGPGQQAVLAAANLVQQARRVVFTGMGSAYLSAMPAFMAAARLHPNVALVETSALLNESPFCDQTVYVVLSRSGQSGEIADFAQLCQGRGGTLIAITMTPNSTLALHADVVVHVPAPFDGLICVKAHTALMLAALLLVTSREELDAHRGALHDAFGLMASCMPAWLDHLSDWPRHADPRSVYFIGAGYGAVTAGLGALLIEEGVWLPAASHSLNGFAHGPLEVVDEAFAGVIIDLEPNDATRRHVEKIRKNAPQTLIISDNARSTYGAPLLGLPLRGLPSAFKPLVAAPSVQLLTFALAARRGHEAGTMRHLNWLVT
ncbi:MAG: SIS domain-containing protein [Deltaproteobacteria bacterium]|nr:SIS domain-containing protein [Deltaproteobacteria bacterium]